MCPRTAPRSHQRWLLQSLDGLLQLGLELAVNRDVALVSQAFVLVLQDGVHQVLHQTSGLLVVALGADDLVGSQNQRVLTLAALGVQRFPEPRTEL